MLQEEKKMYLLLKSVIFHHHGLDKEEKKELDRSAKELVASEELKWVEDFISLDLFSAYERSQKYLSSRIDLLSEEKRINFLADVWDANNKKGHITEMEATSILKMAKTWGVEHQLMKKIRN